MRGRGTLHRVACGCLRPCVHHASPLRDALQLGAPKATGSAPSARPLRPRPQLQAPLSLPATLPPAGPCPLPPRSRIHPWPPAQPSQPRPLRRLPQTPPQEGRGPVVGWHPSAPRTRCTPCSLPQPRRAPRTPLRAQTKAAAATTPAVWARWQRSIRLQTSCPNLNLTFAPCFLMLQPHCPALLLGPKKRAAIRWTCEPDLEAVEVLRLQQKSTQA
mmetsp:Transcript_112508/g.363327  ORF Transcript_112508/g.363327 Transcript_112508/m.363327 type:complete len:216 (+) Transcript_112508:884-1531(+)